MSIANSTVQDLTPASIFSTMEQIHCHAGREVVPIVDQLIPQAFHEACGGRAPLQLDVKHQQRRESERRTLPLPFALIGRNERADLRLDDKNVGDRHAYVQMVSGRWWWVDLKSRPGGFNSAEVSSVWRLLDRQGISIGPYTIRPVGEGPSDEADVSSSPAHLSLELFSGATQQQTWLVDRPLILVGRASFCKLRLHSAMVSRTHCALVNTPGGLWVVDLLSRKGIQVNGAAVRWARLEPGHELRIDPFLIRVRFPAPSVRPVSSAAGLPAQAIIPSESPLAANSVESMLSPLMAQFSLMQQQMFEQFQQTVLMIGQMFGNLHREQVDFVRQELAQIQRLTRELQTLQEEWSTQPPSPQPALPSSPGESPAKAPAVKPPAAIVPPSTSAPPPPEIHTWLSQRLTEINQERQGRWQKILGALTGK